MQYTSPYCCSCLAKRCRDLTVPEILPKIDLPPFDSDSGSSIPWSRLSFSKALLMISSNASPAKNRTVRLQHYNSMKILSGSMGFKPFVVHYKKVLLRIPDSCHASVANVLWDIVGYCTEWYTCWLFQTAGLYDKMQLSFNSICRLSAHLANLERIFKYDLRESLLYEAHTIRFTVKSYWTREHWNKCMNSLIHPTQQ